MVSDPFLYSCSSLETKEAIRIGLNDLIKTVPFILALNKSISSITCNGAEYKINKCCENTVLGYQLIEISNPLGEPFNVLI